MVVNANADAQPWAMMITSEDAGTAFAAMPGTDGDVTVTGGTVEEAGGCEWSFVGGNV